MKSALLVGGSGFIGRGLAAGLSERGVTVHSIDRSVHDVRTPRSAPIPEVDVVFHLAQSPHYRDFPQQARDLFLTNLFSLNEYCAAAIDRARLVVFFSSGSIFGRQTEIVRSDTLPNPEGFYSYTKVAGEQCLAEYAAYFSTLVLRPFQPYGRGQVDKLLPNLAVRIAAGEELTLTAGMRMSFLHLSDLVELTLATVERQLGEGGHLAFNLASPEVVSLKKAAELLAEALGRPLISKNAESDSKIVVAADCRDLYEYCGRTPKIRLREGLVDFVATPEAGA